MGETPDWSAPKLPILGDVIDFTSRYGSLLASLLVVIGVAFPPLGALEVVGSGVQVASDAAGQTGTRLRPLRVFARKATKKYGQTFASSAKDLSEHDQSAAEVRASEIVGALPRRDAYVAALLGAKNFERFALDSWADATEGMSPAGSNYLRSLLRQTGTLIAKYLRDPEIFSTVGTEALRDHAAALVDLRARQDAQGRKLGGLARRVEVLEELGRKLEDELGRRARMAVVVGADAWGIPASWDPLGPDFIPVTQECGIHLDVLWARDRSPFRAVLADAPGARLIDVLGREMRSLATTTRRRWVLLPLESDVLPTSRGQLLLELGLEGQDPGSFGVVTTISGGGSADLGAVARGGASVLSALAQLLPSEPLVMRVEDGVSERSIRLAALVGRFARESMPILEVLTRVRTTSGAVASPGGGSSNAVALIGDTVRRRRQSLGVDAPWPPFSDQATLPGVGADTATCVPSEMCQTTSMLPGCVPEAAFLRHVRDSCAEIWPALVRAYARSGDPARWTAGLRAVSDWADDLECWIAACDMLPDSLLRRPDRLLSHDATIVDRLILALRAAHDDLVDVWLPFASPDLRATLDMKTLTAQPPWLARILATRAPDLLIGRNQEVFLLSRGGEAPIDALQSAGVPPEAVFSLAAASTHDADLHHRISYFRRIVRPYLEEA